MVISQKKIEKVRKGYESGKNFVEVSKKTHLLVSTVYRHYLAWKKGFETPRQYLDKLSEERGVGNHRVYAFLKKRNSKKEPPLDEELYLFQREPSSERNLEEMEELEICLNALHKVNPLYLELIQRRIYQGHEFREIGKALGKSTQRANLQYHEAISSLRRIYTIRNSD